MTDNASTLEAGERVGEAVIDTGLACLVMLARYHGLAADPDQLRHEFAPDRVPFGVAELLLAAKQLGLSASRVSASFGRLPRTPLPAIALGSNGDFFVLARAEEDKVLIHDPRAARPLVIEKAAFDARWAGELILVASRASLAGELARFDFSWFVPALVRHRRLIGEVLLVSFALQLFALATPLFFQVVMDKVLVHRGLSTLDVVAIGLLAVSVFEVVLSGLRSYVFAHTTSRIDVELGARLFRHLLALPLSYFQSRRVGDSVARVRELENVRAFLTGNAITVVLDLFFSVVFLAVMVLYSGWLTLVVLASLPFYAMISLGLTPLLRARLHEKFNRGAENQAFLVESVTGIDTIKSMAIEPQMTRRWDQQLAAYVSASFRANTLATVAHEGVNLVGKLVTVGTLWLGARLVIDGELSVGQLIAFNMLAARVAQPIMRLAQLWTDFQQAGISVQRLGDILNTRTEVSGPNRSTLPPLTGRVRFDQVRFRYRPDGQEVLRGVSLDVAPGEVIGVEG